MLVLADQPNPRRARRPANEVRIMSGTRLFNPADGLSIRDPISDEQMNGNIMNPPRFAQFGGLSSRGKAVYRNTMKIVKPGASTRAEPIK